MIPSSLRSDHNGLCKTRPPLHLFAPPDVRRNNLQGRGKLQAFNSLRAAILGKRSAEAGNKSDRIDPHKQWTELAFVTTILVGLVLSRFTERMTRRFEIE